MAKTETESVPDPPKPLTAQMMQDFRDKVAAYGPRIDASDADPIDKRATLDLLNTLTAMLDFIDGQPAPTWSRWVAAYGDQLRLLNTRLNEILDEPTGACFYNGGCIETTESGCDGLGNFVLGGTCAVPI